MREMSLKTKGLFGTSLSARAHTRAKDIFLITVRYLQLIDFRCIYMQGLVQCIET